MRTYPHKCIRCGFCCLAETCPAGMLRHGVGRFEPCPSLRFSGQRAKCTLVKHGLVPVGEGCCIKARAFKDGVQYDFASLPPALKRRAVADHRRREVQHGVQV